jgi:hypothetical protein
VSSRRDHEASRERQVRRILGRRGFDLLKPQKAFETGYMIREVETGRIVFGDQPARFSKTLDEIEAYVDALKAHD